MSRNTGVRWAVDTLYAPEPAEAVSEPWLEMLFNALSQAVVGVVAYVIMTSNPDAAWALGVALLAILPASAFVTRRIAHRSAAAAAAAAARESGFAPALMSSGITSSPLRPSGSGGGFDDVIENNQTHVRASSVTTKRGLAMRQQSRAESVVDLSSGAGRRGSRYRGCVETCGAVVVVSGFDPVADTARDLLLAADFSTSVAGAMERVFAITDINNGCVEAFTGGGAVISFASRGALKEAVRSAHYIAQIELAPNLKPLRLCCGAAGGSFLSGHLGTEGRTWRVCTGGAAHVAAVLAEACSGYHVRVLFAGTADPKLSKEFMMRQVDLIEFPGSLFEVTPVYAVTEGDGGCDTDLNVLWLHIIGGDFERAKELLDQYDPALEQSFTPVLRKRVAAALADVGREYVASFVMTTECSEVRQELTKRGHFGKQTIKGYRTNEEASIKPGMEVNVAFLAMRVMEAGELNERVTELISQFYITVDTHGGMVESVQAEAFVARFVVGNSFAKIVACAVDLRKKTLEYETGFGIACGVGKYIKSQDSMIVLTTARARALCLSMISLLMSMAAIAEAEIASDDVASALTSDRSKSVTITRGGGGKTKKREVGNDKSQPATDNVEKVLWRQISCEGYYELPAVEELGGLAEMVFTEPSTLFTRAVQQVYKQMWASATDLLQQHSDFVEDDKWAKFLQAATLAADNEERAGIRDSDETLRLRVTLAGCSFDSKEATSDDQMSDCFPASACGPSSPSQAGGRSIASQSTGGECLALHAHARRTALNTDANPLSPSLPLERVHRQHRVAQLWDRRMVRLHLGFHGGDNQDNIQLAEWSGLLTLPKLWSAFHIVATLVECVVTAARAGGEDSPGVYENYIVVSLVLGYLFDLVYLGGIALSFFKPVVTERGIAVTDPREIRNIYLHGWFPIDLAAALPWELLWLPGDRYIYAKYPWLRLNRLLNLFRLPTQMLQVQEAYVPEAHPVAVKVFYNLLLLAYVLFWMGCLWAAFATDSECVDQPVHCMDEYFGATQYAVKPIAERAVIEFHWALRGFAGYGQKWPKTDRQHALCVMNVVIGIAIFATVIAYLQNSMKLTHNEVFLERLDAIVAVAEHRRLDAKTTADILRYHRLLWAKTKQVYEGQFDDLKNELPAELVGELFYFANLKAIDGIDILRHVNEHKIVARIVSKLTVRFGTRGEMVLNRGDSYASRNAGVYFFYKGEAEAAVEGCPVEIIRQGGFWGELTCLLGAPQPADLMLLGFCEMYFLPALEFKKLLTEFPQMVHSFIETATLRREEIRRVLAQPKANDLSDEDDDASSDKDSNVTTEPSGIFDEDYLQTSFCASLTKSGRAGTQVQVSRIRDTRTTPPSSPVHTHTHTHTHIHYRTSARGWTFIYPTSTASFRQPRTAATVGPSKRRT